MDLVERVARRLKLSDLHLLREVVQRGAMAKAAKHLNLTQPAVSKAIAHMEQLLGVRLLDRSRYGATPTVYGEAILKGGVAAFGEIHNAVARVQHLSNPNSGVLSIGCTQPLALGFIPTVIERMRRSYPGIRLRIVEGNQRTHLRQRQIELAFTRLTSEPEPDLDGEVLFDDPLFVGANIGHPRLRGRKVTLRQIYDGPWSILTTTVTSES
jgi:DNA-binding transcriptional LysR family regulator